MDTTNDYLYYNTGNTGIIIIIEQELYLNELWYIAPSRLYIELLYLLIGFVVSLSL